MTHKKTIGAKEYSEDFLNFFLLLFLMRMYNIVERFLFIIYLFIFIYLGLSCVTLVKSLNFSGLRFL